MTFQRVALAHRNVRVAEDERQGQTSIRIGVGVGCGWIEYSEVSQVITM
jgi:hypothetical protein